MKKIKLLILFFLIIMVMSTTYVVSKMIKSRSAIYPYDTTKDYIYDFNQSYANVTNLEFSGNTIKLKHHDHLNKSAFLKVDVETDFMGKYIQPSIEVRSGDLSFVQYLEHGAKGTRYINISSLVKYNQKEITLEEKHITINKNSLKLITFDNKDIKQLKVLVLSPHPDDAEIAAYGLYSDNNDPYVVTITAGEAGKFKYNELYKDKVKHYLKKGELRTWDSITVPLLGGVPSDNIVNFGFFDLSLNSMYKQKNKEIAGTYTETSDINTFRKQNISSLSKGLSGNSSWASLVENMIYLLETTTPDIIVTPYPALDTHPDHKFTTIAIIEALKQLEIKKGNLYLYSNHFVLNEFFPYGMEGGVISMPPSFDTSIYFDSVYSHHLSLEKQMDKVLALEAMHDLRLDTEWRTIEGMMYHTKQKLITEMKGWENSYYKRSVRSNELFFVVDVENIYDERILSKLYGKLD